MRLDQLTRQTAKHILVFGPPKIGGKTRLVGELSRVYKLKWFDLENGRTTLYQLPQEAQANIDMFVIPDTKDFPVAAATIPVVLKGQKTRICNRHGAVSCSICIKNNPADFSEIHLNELKEDEILVIDSMTQLSNSIMSHIGRGKDDLWKPEWNDYRTQGAMLDRILSTIQNAPYNAIVITHEQSVPLEDGKERLVPVAGTSNFARNTAKYFDEVVYCEIKNRRHIAASSTTYSPVVLTGSRTGAELEKETSPSLLSIFTGEKKVDQASVILHQVKQEISK